MIYTTSYLSSTYVDTSLFLILQEENLWYFVHVITIKNQSEFFP